MIAGIRQVQQLERRFARIGAPARTAGLGGSVRRAKSVDRQIKLIDFVRQVNPTLLRYEHVPLMLGVLQKTADTHAEDGGFSFSQRWSYEPDQPNYRRVMFLMPTRYFKSECASRLFSAYLSFRFPEKWAGVTSYNANLAYELNGKAREYYQLAAGRIAGASKSVKRWETGLGGGVWADGTGGALLGRGFHHGTIDDPTKPKDASSLVYQRMFETWYPSTFLSRREPGASIAFVMQRLGPKDAVDYLFRREVGDGTEEAPEHWHVVCFDEIKSSEPLWRGTGPMGLPATCTLEPDTRLVGEALSPSRFSAKEVEALQKSSGTLVAKAQRQQRPTALTGDFWRRGWFRVVDELPEIIYDRGKGWDTAHTRNDRNAASAFVETCRGPGPDGEFKIYVTDADWAWVEQPELVHWMGGPAYADSELVPVKGPHYIEDKASGKGALNWLSAAGVYAEPVSVDGDKFKRASGVQHIVSSGRVCVLRSVVEKLLSGLHADPRRSGRQGLLSVTAESLATGNGDLDLNDAFVQELARHTAPPSHRDHIIEEDLYV
ncbi:MAG: hypothetical protein AAGI08_00170 [Bacteroidota bacterium]